MKQLKFLAAALYICVALPAQSNGNGQLFRDYEELSLGSIKPDGWLKEMLQRQKDGITAKLDESYSLVCGSRNGWLGGDGDQWERGPYWIDGLLPLAYILDDKELKSKASKWVEWILASQQENGQFGPVTDYPYEAGLQRNRSLDWWPRMVALKIIQQHYNATQDARVLPFLTKYFHYQLEILPSLPLDHWSHWAKFRDADNMNVALWLYSKTSDPKLLELCELLHSQGYDFTALFTERDDLAIRGSIHCVDLAQGMKEPLVYSQMSRDAKYLAATLEGIDKIKLYNGFPGGTFGGDEALHGNNPVQGSELCSAVEMMYSYEEMLKISGELRFAEELERIAFNTLPTQISDDFKLHQYFQQPNQVNITYGHHRFDCSNSGTSLLFGFLTGYPCCLCNLHQGWPKFTQNLWLRSSDNSLAALFYAPCHFSTKVNNVDITVREETFYPMDGNIRVSIEKLGKDISFPLIFRIPSWTKGASVKVNGIDVNGVVAGKTCKIERKWKKGDIVELDFPMPVIVSRWYENAASIERGPLVFALKLDEKWECKPFEPGNIHGDSYYEVTTDEMWNYGLILSDIAQPEEKFIVEVDKDKLKSDWYWNTNSSPVTIKCKATPVEGWALYDGDAGPLPFSPIGKNGNTKKTSHRAINPVGIELVPYGATTLRISEFPLLSK